MPLPPPPSMPPPPAPRAPKGGGAKATSNFEAVPQPKQYIPKQFGAKQPTEGGEQPRADDLERAARAAQAAQVAHLQQQQRSVLPPPPGGLLPQGLDPPTAFPSFLAPGLAADRGSSLSVAPIGPVSRPAANLLPDQEFIPINTDSPSLERMQVDGWPVFGAPEPGPFASSLFHSPFATMFGPVTSYGGDGPASASGSGLLADLNADSQVFDIASQRRKPEHGESL